MLIVLPLLHRESSLLSIDERSCEPEGLDILLLMVMLIAEFCFQTYLNARVFCKRPAWSMNW